MSLYRKNITLLKEDCSGLKVKQRLKRMRHFIRKYGQEGRVVVYCSSRKYTDLVANYLSEMFLMRSLSVMLTWNRTSGNSMNCASSVEISVSWLPPQPLVWV